jgi:hypothetical protein
MNVNWNFSIFDEVTKNKPKDFIPELNIIVTRDLFKLRVGLKI